MLYWPMMIQPPSVGTTDQLASNIIQPSPNHKANARAIPAMTVIALLCQALNKFTRIQPTMPVSARGGGRICGAISWGLVDILQFAVNRLCRLYRLPIKEKVRLIAR